MSDTPLTDEAERASRLESRHGFVPEFKQNAVSALTRKLERKLAAIQKLDVFVRDGKIGTVGGGELMIGGTRYVRADGLRAALKS